MARGAQLGPIELAPGAVVRIGNWNQGGKCTVGRSEREGRSGREGVHAPARAAPPRRGAASLSLLRYRAIRAIRHGRPCAKRRPSVATGGLR